MIPCPIAFGLSPVRLKRSRRRGFSVESYRSPRAIESVGHAVGVDEDGVAGFEIEAHLPVYGVRA